ncbi:Panacea domain-containing protein [Coleofasciculus sp. F4-SAH-05]|uniref:Panacea domain-containing protein n=1 Tax=Coleofasciculus sp. F4-SAH-05 TaxID=3069525 RepID=UPI0033040822
MYQASDIAKYFIHYANLEEDGMMTNLKLQKLLYYAQGFHLALFNQPLFREEIKAWQYGPVIEEIYHAYKGYSRNPLPDPENFNPEVISPEIKNLIDEVYSVFGKYTGTVLANLTHQEKPWINTGLNQTITHEIMSDYFKSKIVEN